MKVIKKTNRGAYETKASNKTIGPGKKTDKQDELSIRAALITTTTDKVGHIVNLTRILHKITKFKLTILGYKPKSTLSLNFCDPIIGMPMPGFAAEQFIKYGRGEVPEHCRKIWEKLGDLVSKETGVEINYVGGGPRKVITRLKPMFDLLVIPRTFSDQNSTQNMLTTFDLGFIRTREIPILFWNQPKKWERLIIITAKNDIDYEEIPIKNFLLKFAGVTDQGKQTDSMHLISYHADKEPWEPEIRSSYGILDVRRLPQEERAFTLLVVSSKIARSFTRFRKQREILYNSSSSILIFPS
jgi:hypothetical protein